MPNELQRKAPSNWDVCNLLTEAKTMQTSHNFEMAHFMRLCYDGSILLFYALGLAISVALIAYVLEIISIAL